MDLCMIELINVLLLALMPVCVLSASRFALRILCNVEIAKEYQYLTVMPLNGAMLTWYTLPYRSIVVNNEAWIVTVTFKLGSMIKIQAHDALNLSDWLCVLDLGPDANVLAAAVPSVKRVLLAKETVSKLPRSVVHKGVLKATSTGQKILGGKECGGGQD
ncbi:hypothetical protein GGF31_000098 [Allomyces arbusculus]|nr:hypothetical protein GGF31_000098 [Allomyces arbusculus]